MNVSISRVNALKYYVRCFHIEIGDTESEILKSVLHHSVAEYFDFLVGKVQCRICDPVLPMILPHITNVQRVEGVRGVNQL